MEDRKLAQEIVDRLNKLVEDPETLEALDALINARVPVDPLLVDHPTIQVSGDDDKPLVGFLGLLNGIVGARSNGWGYVAAEYDTDDLLTGFSVLQDEDFSA